MGQQLTNKGEEWETKVLYGNEAKATSLEVGLYDDSVDSIGDTNDLADITTEPTGAAYARQSVDIGVDFTISEDSGDWQAVLADSTFDLSDSNSGNIDSYFVVVNFQADGDGVATDHLLLTGSLDQTYDIASVDTFNQSGGGIKRN